MTKVYFKKEKFENSTISSLEEVNSYLSSARNKARTMDIPNFSYTSYLMNLSSKIKSNLKDCKKTLNWLERSIKNYSNYTDTYVQDFTGFKIDDISENIKSINELY